MKKILITGKNSYIGNSLGNWLAKKTEGYEVDYISVRDSLWKYINFNRYDVVFHVAGIAHIKETKKNQKLYYEINRDLTYEIAKKAKSSGVKQFIFLSSMSVFGLKNGIIDENTPLNPSNAYGKSKIEAENLISQLEDYSFKVAIVRPPMVYGEKCKGNYPKLAKIAINIPCFPKVNNMRSMIYIDNLSEFVKNIIDNETQGIFFPQNKDYISTSEMVELIAKANGKKIKMIIFLNPLIKTFNFSTINKMFGTLAYDLKISNNSSDYRIYSLKQSIERTEMRR